MRIFATLAAPRHLSGYTLLCLALVGASLAPDACAASPAAGALLPPGGQRGQSVTVQAVGETADWPVQVWCDRPGLSWEALEEKGQLRVAIAADAEPGVYFLRLFNAEGVSRPLPFVVGTLPELLEQEPNNTIGDAKPLDSTPIVVNGTLGPQLDVDTFGVQLEAGQTLVADLESHVGLQSPADAVLQLLSADGHVLAQNDDTRALDPRVVFTCPKSGRYMVRLFAFPAAPNSSIALYGNPQAVYRLTLTTGPFLDAALPLAARAGQSTELTLGGTNLSEAEQRLTVTPTADAETVTVWLPDVAQRVVLPVVQPHVLVEAEPNPADQPQSIALPASLTGTLAKPGDKDVFAFDAKQGENWAFRVASRSLGYPLDAVLEAFNAEGKSLGRSDDASREDRDSQLSLKIPADGRYQVRLSDLHGHGGPRYWYRLDAAPLTPGFSLTVEKLAYELKSGKPLEIPVTITREKGFDQEIAFEMRGLPDNVQTELPSSKPGDDSAKKIVLKFTAEGAAHSGPIRILGRSANQPEQVRTATAPLGANQPNFADLWLTILPASDAQ